MDETSLTFFPKGERKVILLGCGEQLCICICIHAFTPLCSSAEDEPRASPHETCALSHIPVFCDK